MDHGVIVDQSWWCHDDGSAMMRAVVRVEVVVMFPTVMLFTLLGGILRGKGGVLKEGRVFRERGGSIKGGGSIERGG